jgi:S-adenosylmethionine:tRNA-ribosyltransferase-isomerase (queuine synthetase)
MTPGYRLAGIRIRNGLSIRVEAVLVSKETEDSWRACLYPADLIESGDRLRFGDASENPACLLAFLDADVIEKHGETVLLSFHFTGAALDDALDRLGQFKP